MHFVIYCKDKPGHGQVRAANREAHLAHLKAQGDALVTAGPLTTDAGDAMVGSLIVLDLPDRGAAEKFATEDPYARAGLFETVEITAWKKIF